MKDLRRKTHLCRFYDILGRLELQIGGVRCLETCTSRSGWPKRGVYFFFERGELRSDSGTGLRVVRVGTHALAKDSRSTLWSRLAQHRGGNHRASIFRLLVGSALAARDPSLTVATWGERSARRHARETERALEKAVSRVVGDMPFLWISVEDPPSPDSRRAYIERNSIALLSNARAQRDAQLDLPSSAWLGLWCTRRDIRRSGLWNSRHVNETYDPAFLDVLERYVG